MSPAFGAADTFALLPALVLVLFACGTLLVDVLPGSGRSAGRRIVVFGLAGLAISAVSLLRQLVLPGGHASIVTAQGAIVLDGLTFFNAAVTCAATVLFYLLSYHFLEIRGEDRAEYYALALTAQAGMYLMAAASELVTLFLSIELTSICFYVLVGFTRADRRSNEGAVKYLLLGALSSGILLYGFSLLYGIAGSTEFGAIAQAVRNRGASDPFVVLATVTVLAGLLFKVSAVPFHTWAPDAYDGAPTPVTAQLSVASKIASFAVLLRFLSGPLAAASSVWAPLVEFAALASMTVGAVAALTQDKLKRLFAYSSIAHAGYILLGLISGNNTGLRGVYVYLLVYAVMNLGAFAVIISLNRGARATETLEDLRGLSETHPVHAALFVVLLLSLAGLPPTAGFVAKYYIFLGLIQAGRYGAAAIASAYVVVSLFFYFRLVQEMYLRPSSGREPLASSFGTRVALYGMAALTLLIGLFPEPLLRLGLHVGTQ